MAQHYQDAMRLISKFGKPDSFITCTCNLEWPEIVNNLRHFESRNDRPDLLSRVFYQKLCDLMNQLIKQNILGSVIAYTYVVE